jgi:enoyl-CoA hydratase/carnithine racemase
LLTEARKVAHNIAQKGPIALSLAKKAIESGYDKELAEGCKLEVEAFAECFTTSDRKEGIEAFIERRPPVFTNK